MREPYPYPPRDIPLSFGKYLAPPWVGGGGRLNSFMIRSPKFQIFQHLEKSREQKFQTLRPGQQTSPALAPANNYGARNINNEGGKDER